MNVLSAVIAVNIATARKAAGLTQRDLALKCGVSPQAASRWETGRDGCPTVENLVAIAAATETTVGRLLGEDGGFGAGWAACRAAMLKGTELAAVAETAVEG